MDTILLITSVDKIGSELEWLDWAVISVFLAVTTGLAFAVKGRQSGLRDFFLSNRNLPWVAVCISLIATEISAAGFVGVPYAAYTGKLLYLQLAIGAILARFIIAHYLIPVFYERQYYSPYEYVGRRLGLGAEKMTSLLFVIGAILGQGVRVFFLAAVVKIITGLPMSYAILLIGAFAALWAFIGGIRTVVWTDVLQFGAMAVAAVTAMGYLIGQTPGGFAHIWSRAYELQQMQVFDFRFDQMLELTIWTGLFGSTFNTLASHGADQMNAQRIFCCRGIPQAKKAMLWSSLSQVFVLLLLFIGLGLFVFYGEQPEMLTDKARRVLQDENAWVFPVYIATMLPAGVKGLLIVGLLAAGMSSLNSALSALAQTSVRAFYQDPDPAEAPEQKSRVHVSRFFIVFWGVILCATAVFFAEFTEFSDLVSLALKMTSFTYGALVGVMILSLLPLGRDGRGIVFAAPFAVLAAFGITLHEGWTHLIVIAGVAALFIYWFYILLQEAEELITITDHDQYIRRALYILLAEIPRTIWVVVGCVLVLYLHFYGEIMQRAYLELAWPWYLPMGVGITVVLGYLLSRPVPHVGQRR